jgi:hypothetical protein
MLLFAGVDVSLIDLKAAAELHALDEGIRVAGIDASPAPKRFIARLVRLRGGPPERGGGEEGHYERADEPCSRGAVVHMQGVTRKLR